MRLWEFPKATIAQVHGYCVGGGTVYGLLTDLTIASDDAYFQMPLPQGFGLPGAQTMIEPWVLMNFKRAAEYLFLAPTIAATQALDWGMVNRVVPRADLDDDGGGHRPDHRPDAADDDPGHQGRSQEGMGDDGDAGPPAAVDRPGGPVQRRLGRPGADGQHERAPAAAERGAVPTRPWDRRKPDRR